MADKPPSMRDFDYFDDEQQPRGLEDVEALFEPSEDERSFDGLMRDFERRQSRYLTQLVTAVVFFAVSIWFLAGYRDWIAYAFREPASPHRLGDIVDVEREALAHNAYVEVEGVTLHRGLVQKVVRGIGVNRQELHYFELSGGRGVFIEAPPEMGIEFTTFVRVAGRVVDPKRDATYEPLLKEYQKRYYQERRPRERIIQVGVAPGEGRGPVLWAIGLLSALAALNAYTIVRFIRHRLRRPR